MITMRVPAADGTGSSKHVPEKASCCYPHQSNCLPSTAANEADGIGDAEPYLWTIFFKIDGETIKQNLASLTGNAVFHFGPGSHGNLGTTSVDAGQTVQIPAAIGEWHTQLQPIVLTQGSATIPVPGIVGVIAVLMEQDDVSDSGAEQGHQALNNFVQTEINNFIHGINLLDFIGVPNPQDKINELIDAMKKKIQDGASGVVSDAIKKAQGFWSNLWSFLNADDTIGSVAWDLQPARHRPASLCDLAGPALAQ